MSYVDHIIKYLSGELSQEEASTFEKELESDAALKREFEEQSAAYRLIRDQLHKRDEKLFRLKLEEAMRHEPPEVKPRLKWLRPWWYIPMATACSLAIIITLLSPPKSQRVFTRYFDPGEDPVVLAYNQNTRGESEPGIRQYYYGNFEESMKLLSVRISQGGDNKELMLYYLLSAIELDLQDEALDRIVFEKSSNMNLANQTLCWYSGLALLKSGNHEAARETIHPLCEQQGPYRSEARKLKKVLLK